MEHIINVINIIAAFLITSININYNHNYKEYNNLIILLNS